MKEFHYVISFFFFKSVQYFTVIPLNSAVYLLYNIVVWAITGICFIRLVFYFVCVFWGSFSGLESRYHPMLQTLTWFSGCSGRVSVVFSWSRLQAGSPRFTTGVLLLPEAAECWWLQTLPGPWALCRPGCCWSETGHLLMCCLLCASALKIVCDQVHK